MIASSFLNCGLADPQMSIVSFLRDKPGAGQEVGWWEGASVMSFLISILFLLNITFPPAYFLLYFTHLPPLKFLILFCLCFSLHHHSFPVIGSILGASSLSVWLLCWQTPQERNKRLEPYIFLGKRVYDEDFWPSSHAPNRVCLQTWSGLCLSLCFLPSRPASSLPASQPDGASVPRGHASSSSHLASPLLPAWTFTFPSPPSKPCPFFSIMSPWCIFKERSWQSPDPSNPGALHRFDWTVPLMCLVCLTLYMSVARIHPTIG